MDNLKAIIESLVFVSETPLSVDRLQSILESVERREIRLTLAELQNDYEVRQGGFLLQEIAGGFQFRTRATHSDWIKKLLKPSPTRLSRAALETLAIIAYKQPIIRADVEHIRGVDSGGVLRMLLERKFIRVLGRKDIPGRPMIYGTTKAFLEIFNLKDLSELPSPKDITSLGIADADDDTDQIDGAQEMAANSSKGAAAIENKAEAAALSSETTTAGHPTGHSTDAPIAQNESNVQTYAGSGGGHLPVSGLEEENGKTTLAGTSISTDKSDNDHAPADKKG